VRLTLQEELSALEQRLQDEGELVLRALRGSLEVLSERDAGRADEVIAFDDEIDRCYFAIEQGAQSLLARQTPVASDLRLVLAVLRVNLHLERMGDYCVTVAKLTKLMEGLEVESGTLVESVLEMGRRADEMVRASLDSFARRNLAGAESLVDLDEAIDAANRRAVEDVIALGHEAEAREYGMRMLVVSRCIERIGDHAVDIGEQTAYLITGEFREFTDASHPAPGR
jgi:phosphate transport system protein